MEKPNIEEIVVKIKEYSQNLRENARLGESKLMLVFAEMIRLMGWQSNQQETNNTQIASLIIETQNLKKISDAGTQSSARSARISSRLSWIAIVIALVSSVFTAGNVYLANQSVQLATQPQIGFYLEPSATSSEYIFGIENNGTIPINNLYVSYGVAGFSKANCNMSSIEATCGGSWFGWEGNVLSSAVAKTPLLPHQSRMVDIYTHSLPPTFISGLEIQVAYTSNIDQQKTTKEFDELLDDAKIYTLNNAKEIPAMAPYVAAFREFTANTSLGLAKVYLQ